MKTVTGLLSLLLLGACSTSLRERGNDVIHADTLFHTQYSQIAIPQSVVVRDEATWEKLWSQQAKIGTTLSRPNVDLSKNMIFAVMLGERPNGCYSVSIDAIRATDDKIVVEFSEATPRTGDFCTYGFTSPAHFVVVPKDPRPVDFLRVAK